ncbi:MAG TPA: response regulator [Candidatus Limnocylindria bacterium]|jgi:PAS domain S-box-containing protein|nr:response regulator [Candidatus Limnocylindria bacterium]
MTRVLVVDDKEENLYYLRALLVGHGYEVEAARHGAEALIMGRQHPPDVIISDLLMPVMDGYTLLRHWKADPLLKRIPFIVYTATYTNPEDEQLALSLGADAFILKPAEPEDFLARLRDVQAGVVTARPPVSESGAEGEGELLKVYSETLIRKLEEKSLQLEYSNRALQEDIAKRKRTEENLRESEERFRATFEQAAVGIAHVSPEGRFIRVNSKLCEITGYTLEELLELTFIDLTLPEERAPGDAARLAMLARTQTSYSSEKRYRRKDARVVWVNVVTTLLRDVAGEPKYFITVVADITERKTLQEQFLRAQRMESIGTLAGGIAHDLNNVLAPILMSIEVLKDSVKDECGLSLLASMQASALRGAELVKQVLSFARGVEGQRIAINPVHIARDLMQVLRETLPKSIEVDFNPGRKIWTVIGDPTQMHQVLLNLCVNARDAMPDGGKLTVALENVMLDETYASMNIDAHTGPYLMMKVVDTGAGIPAEIRDKIFEPFFTTKELGKGTGLGLSTTMAIVKSHGGFINVYSEVGKGTKFQVYFPAQATEAVMDKAAIEQASLPCGHGELVLVVDDEGSIRSVAQRTLERFGYRVLLACNGAEALALYAGRQQEVALVLTDMAMPIIDGAALVVALKAMNPKVKVICSSGLASNDGVAKALGAGVMHFVPKPYTAEVILTTLRSALDEPVR